MNQTATIEQRGEPRRRSAALAAVVTMVVAVLASAWALTTWLSGSDLERVEREHGISLPESVSSVNAMGDASNPILRLIDIDRGASSIFTVHRRDLDLILDQFTWDSDRPFGGRSEIPGNTHYQPTSVPWAPGQEAERVLISHEPPSTADFAAIEVYSMGDSDHVGVWLYSDWN